MECLLMRGFPLEQPGSMPWAPSERLRRTFLRAAMEQRGSRGGGPHTSVLLVGADGRFASLYRVMREGLPTSDM